MYLTRNFCITKTDYNKKLHIQYFLLSRQIENAKNSSKTYSSWVIKTIIYHIYLPATTAELILKITFFLTKGLHHTFLLTFIPLFFAKNELELIAILIATWSFALGIIDFCNFWLQISFLYATLFWTVRNIKKSMQLCTLLNTGRLYQLDYFMAS